MELEWFGRIMALCVIGLFAAIAYAAVQHHKKRITEIQALATQLKFQYFPKGDASIGPLLANLEYFQQGRQRKVTHLLKGQVKRQGQSITVAIFDYQYVVDEPDGDSKISCYSRTALVFYDESLNLPGFRLRGTYLRDKMANFIGLQDINFSEFPTFSKRYQLLGTMPDRIRAVFQPNIIKFYEREKLYTEANGSSVLIFPSETLPTFRQNISIENPGTYAKSPILDATEMRAYLDKGLNLLRLLERNRTQA